MPNQKSSYSTEIIKPENERIFSKNFFTRLIIEVLLIGIVVFGIQQYFESKLAPQTAVDVLTVQNRLNEQKEIYLEAINLMNRHLSKLGFRPNWRDLTNIKDTAYRNTGTTYPTELEINKCFAKLCLYSNDQEIPLTYFHFFTDTGRNTRPILLMVNFVNLVRNDLGNGAAVIDTNGDKYKYIEVHHH